MKCQIEDENCPLGRVFAEVERLCGMVASVACRLHDETTALEQPKAIGSYFTTSSFPVRGDTMVISGSSMPMPNGTHKGQFDVRAVTMFSERQIASGNVSFRIPTSVEMASLPLSPPTPTPSSSLEPPVVMLETSSPSSPPTGTLEEASLTDIQQISNETFSLINVDAPCPESFLQRKLSRIGVVGTNVKVLPMPTTDEGHVVVIFDVKTEEEQRKIHAIVANQDWSKLFHIKSLLTGRPFISVKLSQESLMRAIDIATTNDKNATVETLRFTLLNNDLMHKRTNDRNTKNAMASIKAKLNEEGQRLLGDIQRLFRKRRGSCSC